VVFVIVGTEQLFLKFDIFGCFFAFDGSAGIHEGVLYRERNSQVWNRTEQGDIRFGGFREG
jgi:hypothetical protein